MVQLATGMARSRNSNQVTLQIIERWFKAGNIHPEARAREMMHRGRHGKWLGSIRAKPGNRD